MTAAKVIWQLEWQGEGRMVYLDGGPDNAFWTSEEQGRYHRGRAE